MVHLYCIFIQGALHRNHAEEPLPPLTVFRCMYCKEKTEKATYEDRKTFFVVLKARLRCPQRKEYARYVKIS